MEMRFSIRESVLETDGVHIEVTLFLNVYFLAYRVLHMKDQSRYLPKTNTGGPTLIRSPLAAQFLKFHSGISLQKGASVVRYGFTRMNFQM